MANEFVDTTLMDGFADGPHITEVQTGLANQGLYGPEDYVLESGRKAEAQVLTNNSIRIFDAVFVIQGRRDVIAANNYADVSIDNGAQGMNRNDIIVRRYVKDESTEIEHTEYAVIKGTAVSGEASDPDVTVGDIRSGATLHEMKLYRVKLQGLNIVAVEPLFKVLLNMSTINDSLSYLIGKLQNVHFDVIETDRYYVKKYDDGWFEAWAKTTIDPGEFSFIAFEESSALYRARFTNFGFGIKATEVYDIEVSAANSGIIWCASCRMNSNMSAIDGFVVQHGSDNARTTTLRAHVTGKWK